MKTFGKGFTNCGKRKGTSTENCPLSYSNFCDHLIVAKISSPPPTLSNKGKKQITKGQHGWQKLENSQGSSCRSAQKVPVVLSRKTIPVSRDPHSQAWKSSQHCFPPYQLHEYCTIFSQQ
jgi:hypothetical protein